MSFELDGCGGIRTHKPLAGIRFWRPVRLPISLLFLEVDAQYPQLVISPAFTGIETSPRHRNAVR